MIRNLLVVLALVPAALSGQMRMSLDWANFPVEMERFVESEPGSGQYATAGTFNGVGSMYLSATKKVIDFKGLRIIELGYLGQEPDDKYEFRHESFTIGSLIAVGGGEYAFQATNDGPLDRTVTGKIRIAVGSSRINGTVQEFQMEEHGQVLKGVMNRYVLPRTPAGLTMLKKYDEIFFGGNFAAMEFAR